MQSRLWLIIAGKSDKITLHASVEILIFVQSVAPPHPQFILYCCKIVGFHFLPPSPLPHILYLVSYVVNRSQFSEARWKDIASLVETRNHVQCLQRWKKVGFVLRGSRRCCL